MKNYLLLILLVFWSIPNFSQDFQMPKGPSQDLNRGGNLQNSSIADSLMSRFGDKSTRLNKNPDAKIQDYLMITRQNDTIVVDTSLTHRKISQNKFSQRR